MTDGVIQKRFNVFRSERLGNYITHEETLHLEKDIIYRIETICNGWDNEIAKEIKRYLVGDNQK